MPLPEGPARRVVKKKKPKKKYTPPPSRSDAAQRTGARTPKPKPVPSQSDLEQSGGAHGRKRAEKYQKLEAQRKRIKKAKPPGDKVTDADRRRAEEFKKSDAYFEARKEAVKARYRNASDAEKKLIFGTPREDAKYKGVLDKFKADDDRQTEINRTRLRTTVDRELSGQGKIAKAFNSVANEVTKKRGKDGKGGSIATSLVPGLSLQPKKVREFNERAIKDVVNVPAQAVPSLYVPAAGVVEAAKGRPERLKRFVEDVKQTDPVYNTVAAGVSAARGDSKAAKSHLSKAKKSASEHPGFTALEVYGAKGTLGRGAGTTMRSGVVGKRAKQAASTTRESAVVPGTRVVQKRDYSRDYLRKLRQRKIEKVQIKRAEKTRKRAEAETDPDRKVELKRQAAKQDPRIAKTREIERRVDERVDANEQIRRANRARVQHDVPKILKKVQRSDREAVSLVTQRITRADRDDLKAYRDELAAVTDILDKAGQRANRTLIRSIDRVLANPKANFKAVADAADEYQRLVAPAQKKLVERGLLDEAQEDRAKLMPYAVRNMGAHHDGDKLVDRNGDMLTSETIRAHMAERGVDEPAFLTQAPNQRGARNFNIRAERAQSIRSRRRTGKATVEGTFDADPETLTENAARAQGLVDATDGFRGFVSEFAARGGSGKPRSFAKKTQADKAIANLEAETGQRFRAIRMTVGNSNAQLKAMLDDVDSESLMEQTGAKKSPLVQQIEEALDGKGEGPWTIIPEAAATRLQGHLNSMGQGPGMKSWQIVNQAFRKTVLATSTGWVAGNVLEAGLRSAVAGVGPRSYFTGRKVLKSLEDKDLKAAEEMAVRSVGGGHFAFADRTTRAHAERFQGTRMEGFANALGKFWRTPGPKQVAKAWNEYTGFVFHLSGKLESQFQTAMLGKAIRTDEALMDGATFRLHQKAMEQVAAGKIDTNTVAALGRKVDRMYGKYGKLSPEGRLLVAYYTPFIAWTINAVKFVGDVLPRDHPTLTALIASAEIATEDWRKDHGLDLFMEGAVPGWLQGSVPVGSSGKFRASKYTPFGAFTDPTHTAASNVLPQIAGVLAALEGRDWTGRELKGKGGGESNPLEEAAAAASSFAGGTIPALSLSQRVAKDGPEALNPFKVTAPPKSKTLKKSQNIWSDSGSEGIKWSDESSGGVAWPD